MFIRNFLTNLLTSLPYSSKLSYRYTKQFTRESAKETQRVVNGEESRGGKINQGSKKKADKYNLTHFVKL